MAVVWEKGKDGEMERAWITHSCHIIAVYTPVYCETLLPVLSSTVKYISNDFYSLWWWGRQPPHSTRWGGGWSWIPLSQGTASLGQLRYRRSPAHGRWIDPCTPCSRPTALCRTWWRAGRKTCWRWSKEVVEEEVKMKKRDRVVSSTSSALKSVLLDSVCSGWKVAVLWLIPDKYTAPVLNCFQDKTIACVF